MKKFHLPDSSTNATNTLPQASQIPDGIPSAVLYGPASEKMGF